MKLLIDIENEIAESEQPTAVNNLVDYFNPCIDYVLNFEGFAGYDSKGNPGWKCNTVGDPGGRTVWGICEMAEGKDIVNQLWDMTADDAKIYAKKIYFKNYWIPIHGQGKDLFYATAVLDCAVNNGVNLANKLQLTCLDVTSFCDARIAKLNAAYPNGFILGDPPHDILQDLISRVNKCRTRADNT